MIMNTAIFASRLCRYLSLLLCTASISACDYIAFDDEGEVDAELLCADQDPDAYYCPEIEARQLELCNSGPDGSTLFDIEGKVIDPDETTWDQDEPIAGMKIGLLLYAGPYQAEQTPDWKSLPSPSHWTTSKEDLDLYAGNPSALFALYWTNNRRTENSFALPRLSVPTARFGLREGVENWSLYGELLLADGEDQLYPTGKAYRVDCEFD